MREECEGLVNVCGWVCVVRVLYGGAMIPTSRATQPKTTEVTKNPNLNLSVRTPSFRPASHIGRSVDIFTTTPLPTANRRPPRASPWAPPTSLALQRPVSPSIPWMASIFTVSPHRGIWHALPCSVVQLVRAPREAACFRAPTYPPSAAS